MNNAPAAITYSGLKPYGQTGTGRTLLVTAQHRQLLDGFKKISEIPSSEGYYAQSITKAVESLRGCTAPVNSFIKNGKPNRHCIVFSGFEIEYETGSYYGGPQTDVVIVDIRLTNDRAKDERRAALWQVNATKAGDWRTKEQPESVLAPSSKIPGNADKPIKVGINGHCDKLEHAANMLPIHISRGNNSTLTELKDTGYHLFYVPQSGSNIKAGWSFIRDLGRSISPNNLEAARILAHHMKEAHEQGLYVEWTSHRGGSKVLTHAMKLLAQRQVKLGGRQKIFLSDHTSSHFDADIARRAVEMNTSDAKWHNATPGAAQLIAGKAFGSAELKCSINELIHHTPSDQRIEKIIDIIAKGKESYKKAALTGSIAITLASTYGLSVAFASALVKALGSTILASVPSLNEGYHKSSTEPLKQLIKKVSS
ncbi:hypothetical protein Q2E61_14985 [Microbulbifer thermotolerans]|uniref:hypothetical protein n=1 Tax=Microbulbifer thermotolerans TaxID=252514 RepID=UPI0026718609|nr:hypothetical protein [Microbulbifer thermotolerans]WKT60197.1 hypothetical protein Q2E61_14985 [Microbulbifer thermotolerans]